jgi:hypothetical protein
LSLRSNITQKWDPPPHYPPSYDAYRSPTTQSTSSAITSTPGFYILVTISAYVIYTCSFSVLFAALFFSLRDLHPTPFIYYLFLSTSTFFLGFVAYRLPSYTFEYPESVTTAQILALHFGLAFNFVADIEWIRLGVLPKGDTFLYPELINAPFEHSYREWVKSQPPHLPLIRDTKRFLEVYLMCY